MGPGASWATRKNKVVIGLVASLLLLSFAISLCASASVIKLEYSGHEAGEMGLFQICARTSYSSDDEDCEGISSDDLDTDDCGDNDDCIRFMNAWQAGRGSAVLCVLAAIALTLTAIMTLSKQMESNRAALRVAIVVSVFYFVNAISVTVGYSSFSGYTPYDTSPGGVLFLAWLGIPISIVAGINLK